MLKSYLIIAWRNFIRQMEYSLLNILGLSVGLTCCIVIYVFVQYESGFDRHHQKADQIFRVVQHTKSAGEEFHWNTTAYPLAEAIRNDFSEPLWVTQISGPGNRIMSVERPGQEALRFDQDHVLFADPDYFKVFEVTFIIGNLRSVFRDPYSIVLTESMVHRYFNGEKPESVIGKRVVLNNKENLTVTGIVKDPPANTNYLFKVIIPYQFFKMHNPYNANNWSGNYQGTTFVVLPPDADIKQFEKKIAGWKKKYLKPEDDHRIDYFLQPLTEAHTETLYSNPPGGYIMPKKIINAVSWVGIFILLIACVNFINLATAQATSRSKEVGIRKVIGGTRLQLMKQFLGENALLLIITLLISLSLAQFLLTEMNSILSVIHLEVSLQWRTVMFISLVGVIVMFLAGMYPSVIMSAFQPVQVLKGRLSVKTSGGLSLRRALIILQFAIVQVFVIGTIVIAVQMHYIRSQDLGFNREAILTTFIPDGNKQDAFRQQLSNHSSIEKISFNSGPPTVTERRFGTNFWLPSGSVANSHGAEMKGIDENYLDFYGLTLIAGRNFNMIKEKFDEFIVNEKVIRALGLTPEQALGQRLFINEGAGVIVGVVKDFYNNSLQEEISPCIMLNWNAFLDGISIQLARVNDHPAATLKFIEQTWKEFFPGEIYQYTFLNDFLEQNYILENLVFKGFTIFSVLAVLIGCLGLYGLIRFMTVKKTKEVGIRKVLGASVTSILILFSKEFLWLVVIALALATPVAYYGMQQWLTGFVYRIDMSWWMFAAGGLLAILISLLTISYQSIKTAIANPVDSLRTE